MSRSTKAAKGFATSLFQSLSQILVQIFLAPVVLKMAGREALGAYAAIMQTVAMLLVVDLVGSWLMERFLGHSSGLDDQGKRFRDVFTTARTAILVTNTIYGIGVVAISFFVGRMFHLSADIELQARHALWVVAGWAVIRTPLSAYQNASIATQDLAVVNMLSAGINIARGLASLLFVLLGGGLFGLIISGTVVEAIGSVLYRWRFLSKSPELRPRWGIPDKPLLREMLSFGGYVLFINAGNKLFFRSANMMAALTNGALAASSFYTTQMPTMTGYTILQRFGDNTAPAVYELTGRRENERLRGAFLRMVRLISVLTLPLAAGVILFNHDLVVCWVGQRQWGGDLLTITLALFCVLDGVRGVCVLFAFAQGWMRLLTGTSVFQGIANFGLGYILGKKLGLGGITLALLLVSLPQLLLLQRKIGRSFSIRIVPPLGEILLRAVIPVGLAVMAGEFIHSRIRIAEHHFTGLLLECFAFSVVYFAVAYPISLHPQDRADVRRFAVSALRAKKRLGSQPTLP